MGHDEPEIFLSLHHFDAGRLAVEDRFFKKEDAARLRESA
jgi:hypothetical protein